MGASAAIELIPNYALYGGYSRTRFDLDPIDDLYAVDAGFSVGLRAAYPLVPDTVALVLHSGLATHNLELRANSGRTINADTGSRSGFEVGGGVTARSPRIPAIRTTAVRYRRHDARGFEVFDPRVTPGEWKPVSYFYIYLGFGVVF